MPVSADCIMSRNRLEQHIYDGVLHFARFYAKCEGQIGLPIQIYQNNFQTRFDKRGAQRNCRCRFCNTTFFICH